MQNEVTGYPDCVATAKAQANRLMTAMGGKRELSYSQALEMIAGIHGKKSWAEMSAGFARGESRGAIPATASQASRLRPPLFTAEDFIVFSRRQGLISFSRGRIAQMIQEAVCEVSPLGIISTSLGAHFEKALLERTSGNVDLEGKPYITPGHVRMIVDEMISKADERYKKDICASSVRAFPEADRIIEGAREKIPEMRVLRNKPMDLNNWHGIAITSSPREMVGELKNTGRRVIDLFLKNDLEDIGPDIVSRPLTLGGLFAGDRCVNPLPVLQILSDFSAWAHVGNKHATIILIAMEDARGAIDLKEFLLRARHLNAHVVFVADDGDVPDHVAKGVRQIWIG